MTTRLAVIGAGPGGYVAAFHAADLGMQVTLIDADPNPGGVCTFRGCIPSKALLHAARVLDEAKHADAYGVSFGSGLTFIVRNDGTWYIETADGTGEFINSGTWTAGTPLAPSKGRAAGQK